VRHAHSKRPTRRAKPAVRSGARAKPAPVAAPAAPVDTTPALPADLSIRAVRETAALIGAALAAGSERIDASRVAMVDSAGVQLLIAAGRTAAAHGRALRWAEASSSLIEAASRLGVAGLLGFARSG